MYYRITRLELIFLDWIREHLTSSFLDTVMKGLSFLANGGWFWILLAAVFLCFRKTRRFGVSMAISLLLSTLATNVILKPLVGRARPYEIKWHTPPAIDASLLPSDASFPSGHATVSFSGAFSLFWQDKKAGTPAIILACLIAFSRLYFYLHFPTDILGGLLVGFLASIASSYLMPLSYRGIYTLVNTHRASKGLSPLSCPDFAAKACPAQGTDAAQGTDTPNATDTADASDTSDTSDVTDATDTTNAADATDTDRNA